MSTLSDKIKIFQENDKKTNINTKPDYSIKEEIDHLQIKGEIFVIDSIPSNQEYLPFIPNENIETLIPYHSIKNRLSDEDIGKIIGEKIKSRFNNDFNQYKRKFEGEPVSLEKMKELFNELEKDK